MWKPWVGIAGNLKIIKMTRACGFRFYAHTVPFYSRDLGIVDFGALGVLKPTSYGNCGVTINGTR